MLENLFSMCINAEYESTPESGNYAIIVKNNTLYLMFQWSEGKEDWKNNLNFPVIPYKRCSCLWFCHRGFLKVWKAMRDEIEERVAKILAEGTIENIICVGYSHGAALAVLATEDMCFLHGGNQAVRGYGFGTPRVLWGIIPAKIKKRLEKFLSVRVVPDIVTHLPPVFLGYRNAGTLLKIGKENRYNPLSAHRPEAYELSLEQYDNALKGKQ